MKNLTVYVVTTPEGKVSVRTTPVDVARLAAEGKHYTQDTALLNWKAARTIADTFREAAS